MRYLLLLRLHQPCPTSPSSSWFNSASISSCSSSDQSKAASSSALSASNVLIFAFEWRFLLGFFVTRPVVRLILWRPLRKPFPCIQRHVSNGIHFATYACFALQHIHFSFCNICMFHFATYATFFFFCATSSKFCAED